MSSILIVFNYSIDINTFESKGKDNQSSGTHVETIF